MLTRFGRQVVTATVVLLLIVTILYSFVFTHRAQTFICNQAKVCITISR